MTIAGPLVDCCGRVHTDLRISVTDRCNIRCYYCMPAEGVEFRPHEDILTYEEIERFVRVLTQMGVRKVRITGGEPLVRKNIPRLVEMLARIEQIEDLALTTNGILLDSCAKPLKAAGLKRLNISLDTLDRKKFEEITRRDELPRVLEGIAAAKQAGFETIKLNALAIRGLTEDQIVPLTLFAREHGLQVRFIEFMPVDADRQWDKTQVLSADEILKILAEQIGPLEPVQGNGSRAAATEYQFLDHGDRIGLVRSVTSPFCSHCGRLRLTADGKLRNCLFSDQQWDIRSPLRAAATDQQLAELAHSAVRAKQQIRGANHGHFAQPDRSMHQIGG